ncbi:hypothetical protein K2173_015993 [Erythroxylum novogranatense]|uniref:C3H1-type domain-containing protein n=1 Tax=Erythroxylum novogranatense TaxID=1862640 RepID=A0AAV8SF57_9ROSI|nr:hypothetical protein K2173_015993 [Erythroxylum novogranatense]
MENPPPQTESAKPNPPSHRRYHLKGPTYLSLLRILSYCSDHPQLCRPPQELSLDSGGNEQQQVPEKEASSYLSCDGIDRESSKAQDSVPVDDNKRPVGFQDRGFSDTQLVIDEIDNLMKNEQDGNQSKEKHTFDGDNADGDPRQQVLIDELEHLVKGSGELFPDDNCHLSTTLEENLNRNDGGTASLDNQEQWQGDAGLCNQNVSDASSDRIMTSGGPKPSFASGKSCFSQTNESRVVNEVQQEDLELERPVSACRPVDSPNHMIEEGEIENIEISGEPDMDKRSVGVVSEDAMVLATKEDERAFSVAAQNQSPFRGKVKDFELTSIYADVADNDARQHKAKESTSSEITCKRKLVVYEDPMFAEELVPAKKRETGCGSKERKKVSESKKKSHKGKEQNKGCMASKQKTSTSVKDVASNDLELNGAKVDHDATVRQGTESSKMDDALCNKKKRSAPSEQSKARKKEKKRKKRAEANRKLGVKRLKLRPVLNNPKPVQYCRHYILGRCQRGEECTFSHDTTPVTKSKPCCYFARNSCMKGDDCPFDHQLSKYPCAAFVSKGHCSRGAGCMFSHKMPPKEELQSASNVGSTDLRPLPLTGTSNSKTHLDISANSHQVPKALPRSGGVTSHKKSGHGGEKTLVNLPAVAPKGINFLSTGSSHQNSSNLSEGKNLGVKVGNHVDQSTHVLSVGDQKEKSPSGSVQISNQIAEGTPQTVAIRGINFLSFGRSPVGYSSVGKISSLTANQGDDALKLLNSSLMHNQPISSQSMDSSTQASKVPVKSVSDTKSPLSVLKKTERSGALFKANTALLGESSTDSSSRCNKQTSSVSSVHVSVQESSGTSDKHQNGAAKPGQLRRLPHSSDQASGRMLHTSTPNSAQKALLSTLAFAKKMESEMKINKPNVDDLVDNSGVKKGVGSSSSGGSLNGSAMASKILDFLSGN